MEIKKMEKICINCFKEISEEQYKYNRYFCSSDCESDYITDSEVVALDEFLETKYDLTDLTRQIKLEIKQENNNIKKIKHELKPFGNSLKKFNEIDKRLQKISNIVEMIDTKALERTNIANRAKEYFSNRKKYCEMVQKGSVGLFSDYKSLNNNKNKVLVMQG